MAELRCSVCGREAVIRLRYANLKLCPEHLVSRVEKVVSDTIRRYRMLTPGERVLVAVSGGKDSLALWELLTRLGYKADGLYLDLGIGDYSIRSRRACESFAAERGLVLEVIPVARELGETIDGLVGRVRGKPCSLCGTVKRYLLNRFAFEGGYDALATGHNLDDEAATLLGNVLRWEEGYLARQYPILPGEGKMVRRVKPLVFLSEREMAAYCLITGISYIRDECPHSRGARSIALKHVLNELEDRYPATKITFLKQFYRIRDRFRHLGSPELRDCPICGMPTASEGPCRFCRLRKEVSHGTPT